MGSAASSTSSNSTLNLTISSSAAASPVSNGAANASDYLRRIYWFQEILQRGSKCIVFKAKLLDQNRLAVDGITKIPNLVAIKVINKMQAEEACVQHAKEEFKFLSKHPHQAAVAVYEMYETSMTLFIVMQYLDGGSIYDVVHERGSLSEDVAATVIQQLASVVALVATKGFQLRNIRGSNIYFVDKNSTQIKLGTFKNMMPVKHSQTKTQQFLRSFENETYEEKVDMWSLGVLLYFMLSGEFPFQCNGVSTTTKSVESYSSVMHGEFDFSQNVWETRSPECKALIKRLLVNDSPKSTTASDILKDPWIRQYSQQQNGSQEKVISRGSVTPEEECVVG